MQSLFSRQIEPTLAFHLKKFAYQVFEKRVVELTMEEYAEAYYHAYHEKTLYEKILQSEAACGVVITDQVIQAMVSSLSERGRGEYFSQDLQTDNLQAVDYIMALRNELTVEAVLVRVAFATEPVSRQEIEDYYSKHQDSFSFSEQRSTRHIFISTENRYSHLPKDSLLRRTIRLRSSLQNAPQLFSQEARIHSDCPTAIDGGDLGRVSRGDLCAALDNVLFNLAAGEISPIIQTARGFHILFCEAIHAGQGLSLQEAYRRIHQILTRKKRIRACRIWLKSLFHH